ncbi:hypothetical protein [uncultured Limosilactobacillus sp.]|uniref:hypothetical protein n=1 Tax=uncultured Limosilactobacillus sp. TaxID=2837629 RepID=UPI0025EB0DFD|nr:hypothetical protein [uncultured Limosilactobacillus sp.]
MKIDEFIEQVNQNDRMYAEKVDGVVAIYDDSEHEVLDIRFDATNLLDINYFINNFGSCFGKPSREYLSALIEEFLHTPIKERFHEKKYVLSAMRYVEGPIAIKQYVTGYQPSGDYVTFDFGSKENAREYTGDDLHIMSQWFPKEAVDAMKEPVEDDNE